MKEINKEELLDRYNAGTASEAEKALVESWYMRAQFPANLPDAEQVLVDQIKSRNQLIQHMQMRKTVKLWPRIAVAAAAVAAIVFGVWFFNSDTGVPEVNSGLNVEAKNDIAPGKNGATITLANGKVIQLSDAKSGVVVGDDLKYNDGVAVQGGGPDLHQDDVMQLTASTAKGQTYQFTLPDGTKVWLNADSKISFPSQFSGKERKILLEGEAYFEVVHNARQPFRVESRGQVVEDIGTEFNINAYSDEGSTKTTLVEGSASVNKIVLKPNQQAVLLPTSVQDAVGRGGQIKVTDVDTELAVAWKNNEFMFESQSIENIMKMVERWYDVEVIYKGEKSVEKYSGSVSRFDNVSKVLRILESSGAVHFKIEGRKIYVSP